MDREQILSSQIFEHFESFKQALNPYNIPPDTDLLDEFDRATKTGYVLDPSKGREPFSLMFRDNHDFKMLDSSDKFSQMSIGYTLVFLFSKFSFYFALIPLGIYALSIAILYSTGNGCLQDSQVFQINQEITGLSRLARLNELYPQSPVPSRLGEIISDPGIDKGFRRYLYLNCFVIYNTDKCKFLESLDCKSSYTQQCETANMEAFLETYINGICHKKYST